jgi:hypothetical protein
VVASLALTGLKPAPVRASTYALVVDAVVATPDKVTVSRGDYENATRTWHGSGVSAVGHERWTLDMTISACGSVGCNGIWELRSVSHPTDTVKGQLQSNRCSQPFYMYNGVGTGRFAGATQLSGGEDFHQVTVPPAGPSCGPPAFLPPTTDWLVVAALPIYAGSIKLHAYY